VRTGEFKIFDGSIETESVDDLSNANIKFIVDAASVDVIAESTSRNRFHCKRLEEDTRQPLCSDWQIDHLRSRKRSSSCIEVILDVDRTLFGLDWGIPRLGDQITLMGHLLYQEEKE